MTLSKKKAQKIVDIGVNAIGNLIDRNPETVFACSDLFEHAQYHIEQEVGDVYYVDADRAPTDISDFANDAVIIATEGTKHARDMSHREFRAL